MHQAIRKHFVKHFNVCKGKALKRVTRNFKLEFGMQSS